MFDEDDALLMVKDVLKNRKKQEGCEAIIIGNSVVASDKLVQNLRDVFDPIIQEKSTEVVQSGTYLQVQADLLNTKQQKEVGSRQADDASAAEAGNEKKDRKEERRKKANEGKGGGGTQVGLFVCVMFDWFFN